MGVEMQLAQILAVLIQCPRFVPSGRDTRVVLPLVEELQVFRILPVDCLQRKVCVELGDVATVDD